MFFTYMTFSGVVLAQKVSPNIVLQNGNLDSDWKVQLRWANGINDNLSCAFSPKNYVYVYRNGSVYQYNGANISLPNGGSLIMNDVGINNTSTWKMDYQVAGTFSCLKWKVSQTISITTKPLKEPKKVKASDSTSNDALLNQIRLSWEKGTDVPDNIHHYLIYKDGDFTTPVKHVTGQEPRYWIDTDVHPGEKHTYSIRTWVNSTQWGTHFSDTVTVAGSTLPRMTATDGEFFNRVEIKWPKMNTSVRSIKIFRSGVEIHSRTDMNETPTFPDDFRIPGLKYTYTLIPYKDAGATDAYPTLTDTGFARKDGRIRGSVKAPFGGPVEGATVYAERLTDVEQGETEPKIYSALTDAQGLFEIKDIYYHSDATFKVHAEKGDHGFNPAVYESIILDQSAPAYALPSPSFVDTSSFTIQGRIVQKLAGDEAAVEGVEILVNDVFKGTKTDPEGKYSLTVEEIGTYTFTPRFLNHVFTPVKETISIESDVTAVSFEDIEKDTLSGYFLGGCGIYIGQASLRIFNSHNPTAAFDTTITTDEGSGYFKIILPSREYTMEVVAFSPANAQSPSEESVLDFFAPLKIDLTEQSVQHNFVYRQPPEIEIIGLPTPGCAPFDVPVVEQIVKYPFEIRVFESFGTESCLTSSGYVVIYDEVKDGGGSPDTLLLEGGIAKYDLLPGEPNILDGGAHPYQKKISIHANVEGQTEDAEQYVLIEGNRPREQTFATVSPEVPFMILRDPPGDGSYSFLSNNTTTRTAMRFFSKSDQSSKAWGEVKVGNKTLQGMGIFIETEFWASIKGSFEVGASLNSTTEFGLSISNKEEFTTSGNPGITGESGDLFVGSAMNIIYALTDVIRYNPESCAVETSTDIIMGTDGFATTFMYTESHIRNVLIPDLAAIENLYKKENNDSSKLYANQIDVWRQTLERNQELKQKAVKINNRSFSAGSDFNSSVEVSTSSSISLEFSLFIEKSVGVEAGIEIAGVGFSGGIEAKFRSELGGSKSQNIEHKRTTGFYLKDDDLGDFFSVDIKEDLVYGTPVFALVSGRSSCPWEPGTQPREGVQLTVDKPVQYDISQDAAAAFVLNLGNTSQSGEDQTYNLVFLQESNPEGAVLTLGGSEVQGGILTPYNIPAGSSLNATVTVKRGPQSNAYRDLRFALLSSCDDGVIADTVSFSVFFKSNCSAIAISKPFNHWLINQNSNHHLAVEIGGYDKTKLNEIILQYKNVKSSVWESSTGLTAENLPGNTATIDWDVTTLEDGDYEIRIKVICSENSEYSFSDHVSGTIDRSAPSLFGVPEPADGTFSTGDEISATFNENLNCFTLSKANVILKDKDSGVVYDVDMGCSQNKILIVPLTEENFSNRAMEVSLLEIEDTYGNVRGDIITWDFDIVDAELMPGEDADSDGDGKINTTDNCPFAANPKQEDSDDDGIGDVCDEDIDGDGVMNGVDNCPYFSNADQADTDGNGVGDVCEAGGDGDGDGVANEEDNCPSVANGDQQDADNDGIGDLCDDDRDGDGVMNAEDNCPSTSNPDQADEDDDGVGDACHVVTGAGDEINSVRQMELYPNPAAHEINIAFELEMSARVTVNIFDVANKLVQPVMNESLLKGKYNRAFNVRDLNNGLYIIQINKNGNVQAKKLFIQK